MLHKIDTERKIYVIESKYGKQTGYTCLGFENAYRDAIKVWAWLTAERANMSITEPSRDLIGTAAGYQEYLDMMSMGAAYNAQTKKRCNANLTPELVKYEGQRVEAVDQYGETRRFIVGKSNGWMPVHLEIARRDSSGGMAVHGSPFKSVKLIGKGR